MKYAKCIDTGGYRSLELGKVYKVFKDDNEFLFIHTGAILRQIHDGHPPDVGGFSRKRFIRADHHNTKLGKIFYK